jgi:hypothetical protein
LRAPTKKEDMSDLERAGPQVICDETRLRAHGYQLRCHEQVGHDGEHRWTPELLRALPEQRDRGGAR